MITFNGMHKIVIQQFRGSITLVLLHIICVPVKVF